MPPLHELIHPPATTRLDAPALPARVVLLPALPPLPRARVRLLAASILALAILGAAFIFLSTRMASKPRWWSDHPIAGPEVAEEVESGMLRHLTAVRAADPAFTPTRDVAWRSERWSISLSQDDANAWLAARLPEYLANQQPPIRWPREVEDVRVWFNDGRVTLAAKLRQNGAVHYVGTTLKPTIRPDGSMWMPSEGLRVGDLSAPAWSLGAARSLCGDPIPDNIASLPEIRTMLGAFENDNPVLRDAVVRLEGGRRVRLLSIVPSNGRLTITCLTEKRP